MKEIGLEEGLFKKEGMWVCIALADRERLAEVVIQYFRGMYLLVFF
jgi:hypothetical protein